MTTTPAALPFRLRASLLPAYRAVCPHLRRLVRPVFARPAGAAECPGPAQSYSLRLHTLSLIACLLLLPCATPSAHADEPLPLRVYTQHDGLFNNQARQVVQLPDGRMLVEVEGMLCLFDGARFHALDFDRNRGLNIESFFGVASYLDRQHRIWIRNLHHLFAIDARSAAVYSVARLLRPSGLNLDSIRNFFIDAEGSAWLSTADGGIYVFQWNRPARRVLAIREKSPENILYSLNDVVQVGALHYFFFSNGMMECWDVKAGRKMYAQRLDTPQRGYTLRAIAWDSGTILVRTSQGAQQFATGPRTLSTLLADPHIIALRKTRSGLSILCPNRLVRFNRQLRPTVEYDRFLLPESGDELIPDFTDVAEDREGGLWLTLREGGVAYHSPARPLAEHHRVSDETGRTQSVQRFLRTATDEVIAATSAGLYRLSPTDEFLRMGGAFNYIYATSLHTDADGTLWATSSQGEIVRQSAGAPTDLFTPDDTPLWGRIPFCLPLDSTTRLIAVKMNRLALFQPAQRKVEVLTARYPQLQQFRYITDACPWQQGYIIGTQNGFYYFDAVRRRPDFERLAALNANAWSDKCNCLLTDPAGRVWVGTQNGLFLLDAEGRPALRLSMADGLPSSGILSLALDAYGQLWAATFNGVCRITLPAASRQSAAVPDKSRLRILSISAADGIAGHTLQERAAVGTADGRMLFGTADGYYEVNMRRMSVPSDPLRVQLLDIRLNGRSVSPDTLRRLAPEARNLSFDFSVLRYAAPQHIRYRYRTGSSAPWTLVSGQHGLITVSLSLLPPGRYDVEVQAAHEGGPWSASAQIEFRILPPWWRSWWALTLYALLLAAAAAFAVRRYVSTHDRRQEQLRRDKARLEREQLNEERLRFYTNITHELRTPLTLILGPIDDLVAEPTLPEPLRRRVDTIRSSAERLLTLVNQLLEFRRTETSHRTLQLHTASLVGHIGDIFERFSSANRNEHVHYRLDVRLADVPTTFDADILTTILTNLLSNASKHTEQGEISLQLDQTPEEVRISVADTGRGIASADLPHIFERYYQAAGASPSSGTGIGLALSQALATLHGGRITVMSTEGRGSTFTLHLPATMLHADGPSAPDASTSTPPAPDAALPTPDEPTADDDPVSILLVENDDQIRAYLADILQPYHLILTRNGREGATAALTEVPDIIITDVMMPEMDGNEMTRLLRADRRTSHIPVVMLTAKDSLDARDEGYAAGADAYVTKPFTSRTIRAIVAGVLRRRTLTAAQLHQSAAAPVRQPDSSEPPTPDAAGGETFALSPLDRQFIDELNRIIDDNIARPDLNIQLLCRELYFSRTSLYRKVKALLGLSANEYIRKRRLQRAYQRLNAPDAMRYTVAAIANECGFSSLSYFRSCYKEEFGELPRN